MEQGLCGLGWLQTCCLAEDVLELLILLSLPPTRYGLPVYANMPRLLQCWRQSLGLLCVLTTHQATASAQAWRGKSSFLIACVLSVGFDVSVVQWAHCVLQIQAFYCFFEPTSFGRQRCRETKNGEIMPYIHLRGKNSICLSKHKERTI